MLGKGLSLVGFMDQKQAIDYLAKRCQVTGKTSRDLNEHWKKAKAQLGPRVEDAGKPEILDIPPEHKSYLDAIEKHPRFHEVLNDVRAWSFRLVKIEPLLAFQFDISIEQAIAAAVCPSGPDLHYSLKECLPQVIPDIVSRLEDIPNGFRIISPETNLRTVGKEEAFNQAIGLKLAGVRFGRGIPWMQVTRHNSKCYLYNGYHRAYRLRKMGATHVPCILLEVDRFSRAIAGPAGFFGSDVMRDKDPPTCAHFAQGRAYPVNLRLVEKIIEVTWREGFRPLTAWT